MLAVLLTVVSLAPAAATATADQSVVTATLYPSSGGSVSTPPPVTLSSLGGCPAYDGSNPMYSYPGDQPFEATASSWAVSTLLSCGLQVPLTDVTDVQISNPSQGFEAPLSQADLSVPSPFEDPNSQPVISYDGNEDLITYFRPWRGGSDQNGRDEFTQGSPVAIVVYENGPPLNVIATAQTTSKLTKRFSATVRTASGAPIPASALTWSWNFGDGQSSSEPSPTHAFQPDAVYPVTVQVTDQSAGTGGTDTIDVTFSSSSNSGSAGQSGAGSSLDSRSPTGGQHSGGSQTGGTPHKSTSGGAAPSNAAVATGSGASSPASSATSVAPTATAKHASTPHAPSANPEHAPAHSPAPTQRIATAPPPAEDSPVVVGQLISDITPLPATASPLVHLVSGSLASARAVRGAIRATPLPVLAAGLAVALLFGLGAGHELRWRRVRA